VKSDEPHPSGLDQRAQDELRGNLRRLVSDTLLGLRQAQGLRTDVQTSGWGFEHFLEGAYQAAMNTASFRAVIDVVRRDETLRRNLLVRDSSGDPLPAGEEELGFGHQRIKPFLRHYLARNRSLKWDEAVFDQVFADLLTYLKHPFVAVEEIAPLLGFSTTLGSIEFSETVQIRRLSDDEKTAATGRVPPIPGLPVGPNLLDMAFSNYAITVDGQIPKNGPVSNQGFKEVDDVLTTLRLYQDAWVGTSSRWFEATTPTFQHIEAFRGSVRSSLWMPFGEYQVDGADVPRLIELYEWVAAMPETGPLRTPIRRLNQSYDRPSDEDRLIDYWIALESLFLDDQGELTYKASIRIARLVGDDLTTRKAIKKQISASYSERSKVVHGKATRWDLREVAAETGQVLRTAIQRWLDPAFSSSIEEIEDEFFN